MSLIELEHVSKEFKIFKREKGVKAALGSLLHRKYEIKRAVNDVSFSIAKGELVGYIGSNGAGKSTTIKMLSGILVPTEGTVLIDGRAPYRNRKENARKIGVVFGQRSQLYWNLPVEETFELYRKMYKVDRARFKRNLDFYVELLDLSGMLRSPVRQLSLGQRMRAELVIALLHDPEILYLDEPTIGLDLLVKQKIREFIRQVNREKNTTVILTTHDMDDIEQICDRIITIDRGEIVYDGSREQFKKRFSAGHVLTVDFKREPLPFGDPRLEIVKSEGQRQILRFDKERIGMDEVLAILSRCGDIVDLQIKEPEIEEAVGNLYREANRQTGLGRTPASPA